MNKVVVNFKTVDEQWDKEISKYRFDVYHLSGWLTASTIIDKGVPKGIVAEYNNKKVFFPIIIREVDNECWDATSTYGYGGPIIDDSLTNKEIDIILEHIKLFLLEKGCVSWFIRLHPIINKEWNTSIGNTVTHGPTLISDLSKSEEEHWEETSVWHRKNIKRAMKKNVVTKIEDLSEDNIQIFSDIYKENMLNVNASQYYYFDDDYFYNLSERLTDRILLITAYQEDITIAALLCTICEETGIINTHLGGTLNDYRRLQPAKLITSVARDWGRENNYKFLHFGGGVGASLDSLYEYKKGFSSYELEFKTHRIIIDSEKYQLLVNNANLTKTDLNSEYFPLYRA